MSEVFGIIGGTGPAGLGLAQRLCSLGHRVVVGSRDEARAESVVAELERPGDSSGTVVGSTNETAARGEIVVVATPWDAIARTVSPLAELLSGKIVISMVNALTRQGSEFQALTLARGSAAQTVQSILPHSRVVAALQHVPARELGAWAEPLDADILICGDDVEARRKVMTIVERIDGARAFDAGSLASAGAIEAMTAVLLNLNIRYKSHTALRILGIEGDRPW
ncbi:MAG: NADPH-dependent F420 reductase [Acidimicrobiales bacterium]